MPRRNQTQLIEATLPELSATGLGATPADIADSLREVRRDGVAIAHGEVTPGVVGIAAPVFDAGRAPIAALCVTIAETELAPGGRCLSEIAVAVKAAAEAISAALSERRDEADASAPGPTAPTDRPRAIVEQGANR